VTSVTFVPAEGLISIAACLKAAKSEMNFLLYVVHNGRQLWSRMSPEEDLATFLRDPELVQKVVEIAAKGENHKLHPGILFEYRLDPYRVSYAMCAAAMLYP